MYTLVLVLHLIVCIFLIFIVLIQSSKGAEMGAAFGGSSQTIFGSRGAATFMNKLTTVVAVVFMITSLSLAALSIRRGDITPEQIPVQESPAKRFLDTRSGPIQEQPVSGGQGPAQENPLQPAGQGK